MPWDPDQYRIFQSERSAPFEDLAGLVRVRDGQRVIDLGCGTGELTLRLAERLPRSDVLGIDASREMLEQAAALSRTGLRFERWGIEEAAGAWDVVFSHAALQWVDRHDELVPRLFALLRPGGQIAVQVPSNHGHPTHMLMTETAAEAPFAEALRGWSRTSPVLPIDEYASLLHRCGATGIVLFEKVYAHVLADADAMADRTAGTALVPYFERLPKGLRDAFMERYRQKLRVRFPATPVFYPFRRTLFTASREG